MSEAAGKPGKVKATDGHWRPSLSSKHWTLAKSQTLHWALKTQRWICFIQLLAPGPLIAGICRNVCRYLLINSPTTEWELPGQILSGNLKSGVLWTHWVAEWGWWFLHAGRFLINRPQVPYLYRFYFIGQRDPATDFCYWGIIDL